MPTLPSVETEVKWFLQTPYISAWSLEVSQNPMGYGIEPPYFYDP
jgi:hypothetical protein